MAARAACRTLVVLCVGCAIGAAVTSASSRHQPRGEVTTSGKEGVHVCPQLASPLPRNKNRRSGHILVPRRAAKITLCRYFGTLEPNNPHQGALVGERVIRKGATLAALTHDFDSLKPFPNGVIHCEIDDGAVMYATFEYRAEASVPLKISLSGCRSAYNGRLHRAFFLSSELFHRLERLTKGR